MKSISNSFLVVILAAITMASCKRYLEVGSPRTQLSSASLFNSDATATAAQAAIYSQMESQGIIYNLISHTGLSADEFRLNTSSVAFVDIYTNNLTAENTLIASHWNNGYKYIYQANAILEGLSKSSAISDPVRKQLEGEALMMRAFFHFYLLNLYGDVPVVRSTDYTVNATLPRKPINEVYNFIIGDLQLAIPLLNENYQSGTNTSTVERARPNRSAAIALLSRAYLYAGNWQKAEEMASLIIGNSTLYILVGDMNNVFLKNSKEAIWQIMPVLPRYNTFAGGTLIVTGAPSGVFLDPVFVNQFRPGDNRRITWISSISSGSTTYHFPYKYKVGQNAASITEYTTILRISEQYLIRAEARAMQDNLGQAEEDLNKIRKRAGLSSLVGLSRTELLDSIQAERKFELFSECGDRWLNLKRKGAATDVLSIVKGSNWNSNDQLYPIPLNEIIRNPSLVQNPGY